ncbi:hypothetical protein ACWH9Q_17650, partial [Bacillus subtilis]
MSYVNELKSKHGGLTAHIVKTEKFKTVSLIFKMLAPLTKDQVTKRALLPHVLLRGTKSHPKTAELRSYLDELYGTSVSADLTKNGERHTRPHRHRDGQRSQKNVSRDGGGESSDASLPRILGVHV